MLFRSLKTLEDLRAQGCHFGPAAARAFAGTRMEMAGFLETAQNEGWRVVTPVAASLSVGGPVARDAFATLRDTLVAGIEDLGGVDGVLLLASLGQVPRRRSQAALERLREAHASVLGVVTNRLRPSEADADRHPTYRYYTSTAPEGASDDLRQRFRRWLEG